MDYVTPMHIALATPLAIAAIYACLKVKQKLDEEPRHVKLSTKEHAKLFYYAFMYPNTIKPFPQQIHTKNKKLHNNQRKWIQIGRLKNEMKHLKARYKRFKEYSHTMPVEDIKISLKEVSKELKKYKYTRKKLIRQVLMSPGE